VSQGDGLTNPYTLGDEGDRKGLHPSQPHSRLYYDYEAAPQGRS